MKKIIIFILAISACLLAISYHKTVQADLEHQLIAAAYAGDLITVKDLLDQGVYPYHAFYVNDAARHYQNMDFNVLQAAASSGNEKLISYLIEKKFDLDQTNQHNWTALFVAIRDGHAESAARLIQAGANLNIPTDTGATPLIMLMLADFPSEQERYLLAEYLLKREADPNLQTQWKTDAIFYAVTELKDLSMVKLLVSYKANVCQLYEGKKLTELAHKALRPFLQKTYQAQCKK